MVSLFEEALHMHERYQGKLEVKAKVPLRNAYDLSLAYSPGVAEPCKVIHQEPSKIYDYTLKANTVAVVSNGSAVLGLGNIGAEAALPVNEQMKIAAVEAIANLITEDELRADYVIPAPFDPRVAPAVAAAVAKAAMETGVAQVIVDPKEVEKRTRQLAVIVGESEHDYL